MVSFSCPPPPPRTIFHSYSPTRGIPSGSPNLELHCELQSPLPHQHRQGPSTSTHPARCSLALDHLNPSFPVLKWGGNGYPIPVTLRVPPPQLNRSMLLSRGLPQLVLSVLLSQGTWRLGVLQQEESGFLPAATPPPPSTGLLFPMLVSLVLLSWDLFPVHPTPFGTPSESPDPELRQRTFSMEPRPPHQRHLGNGPSTHPVNMAFRHPTHQRVVFHW